MPTPDISPRTVIGQRIPVLLNPSAGSASEERAAQLIDVFGAAGVIADIETLEPDGFVERIRELMNAGAPAVAVGGGDGTISSAVDVLAGSDTVLVPLPMGTLNHFANRYGLGKLEAVAHALTDGTIATIPVGEVNGHMFVNNASCGIYPHMVRKRDALKKYLTKWPAAVVASFLILVRRPLVELDLEVGSQRMARKTTTLWIGIGRDSLRLPVPGDADKDGDVLELVIPRPLSRLHLIVVALRVWTKLRSHQKALDDQLEILWVKEFSLRSRRAIDVATDGEVDRLSGPVHFRFRPHALRVLCLIAPDAGGGGGPE